MRITLTLSTNLNCTPFDIFDREIDEVIMLTNFYLKLGSTKEEINQENNKVVNYNDDFWNFE